MSKMHREAQNQGRKTSRLAIISILFGLSGFCSWIYTRLFWFPNSPGEEAVLTFVVFFLYLSIPIALVLAIISLLSIKAKGEKTTLRGKGSPIAGLAFALFLVAVVFILPLIPTESGYREACQYLMREIRTQVINYAANNNNTYPEADKWCDLLIEYSNAFAPILSCPATRKMRSTYAINPNCGPNSPPDTVLLFETKDGWNQFGGPEILTTENHNGKGCNVCFNDGSVRFVETPDLGKLKWRTEEPNDVK